jgi:hypothetical protein
VRLPSVAGETGDMTVLGHVRHRLVVAPDWDALLQRSGLNEDLA